MGHSLILLALVLCSFQIAPSKVRFEVWSRAITAPVSARSALRVQQTNS
jgi:hypothetical protein